ncbi:MAG: hypothetical protein IKL84_06475 [Clostridia bacterium]|nr:hypothetical protein [Clostridia bacterium]
MEAILSHPIPIAALVAALIVLYLLEARAKRKGIFAAIGFVVHLGLIVFFVAVGASLEELLFVLLFSSAIALTWRGKA